MNMKVIGTFWAKIYVGLRVGYSDVFIDSQIAIDNIQTFVNNKGLCVNVQQVEYLYSDGYESGLAVELINYPRFPKSDDEIRELALQLANELMINCKQNRVTVMFPDTTILLGEVNGDN